MSITIYHNPNCGTSRNTLAMIKVSGENPIVIEYLQTPPTKAMLVAMIQAAGLTVRNAMRTNVPEYADNQLDHAALSDDVLLDWMLKHPILINRPFVVSPKGTRLCRPSELVLELLPNPHIGVFTKEDGEKVVFA
ncbi:MAG: arsenate reductase (glutaredoxin) [Proteobacteria bacterium]|nr:arsenate reductase (glutaredoxin) [Pseudomonadota bacterium]